MSFKKIVSRIRFVIVLVSNCKILAPRLNVAFVTVDIQVTTIIEHGPTFILITFKYKVARRASLVL
jgi:hypothetical protein